MDEKTIKAIKTMSDNQLAEYVKRELCSDVFFRDAILWCLSIGGKRAKEMRSIISKGDRVELIPVKDGVKVVRVRREEIRK